MAAFNRALELRCLGDLAGSRMLMLEAADLGHTDAMHNVACMYEEGLGGDADLKEAVKWFTAASEEGVPVSTLRLALLVSQGSGVAPDARRATALFLRAAEAGLGAAQALVGIAYRDGVGVEVDIRQAFRWLQLAAHQRVGPACSAVGSMFETGSGVQRNLEQAFLWQHRAAGQGDLMGQYNLGRLYAQGIGINVDKTAALAWFTAAAERGDADSAHAVGLCHLRGHGTAEDPSAAAHWFETASASGHALATLYLAGLLADGRGIPADWVRAHELFELASARGVDVSEQSAVFARIRQEELEQPSTGVDGLDLRPDGNTVGTVDDFRTRARRQACFFAFHLFPEWLFAARVDRGRMNPPDMQVCVVQLWLEAAKLALYAPVKTAYPLLLPRCDELEADGVLWARISMYPFPYAPEPVVLLIERSGAQSEIILVETSASGSHIATSINAQGQHGISQLPIDPRPSVLGAAMAAEAQGYEIAEPSDEEVMLQLFTYVELHHEFEAARKMSGAARSFAP